MAHFRLFVYSKVGICFCSSIAMAVVGQGITDGFDSNIHVFCL